MLKNKGCGLYEFFMPYTISLDYKDTITIPTGIRVNIEDGWMLKLLPSYNFASNYKLRFTEGEKFIFPYSYYEENEGHILVSLQTEANYNWMKVLFNQNDVFVNGIFIPYGETSS